MLDGQFSPRQPIQFESEAHPAPARSLVFVDDGTFSDHTVTLPALIAGDLIVLWDDANKASSGAPAQVTPAGFTLLGTSSYSISSRSNRGGILAKIADGTETTVSMTDGSESNRKRSSVFRSPQGPLTGFTASTFNAQGASNPAEQTVDLTTSPPAFPVLALAAICSRSSAITPAGASSADWEYVAQSWLTSAYRIFNPGDALHNLVWDSDTTSNLLSGYIALF